VQFRGSKRRNQLSTAQQNFHYALTTVTTVRGGRVTEQIVRNFLFYMCDWLRDGRSGDRIPVGGARFYAPLQIGPGDHPASCKMVTGSFPEVKSVQGMTWSRKSRAIPLLPLWGRTVCTEPQCLYKGAFYLTLLTKTRHRRDILRRKRRY